jgi:TonB family protein
LFAWYTGRLKDAILNMLSDDERIRRGKYQVTVRVWVGADGKVERVKLQSTSGNSELDAAIENVLQKIERMEQPPLEMPQPVTLRIVSK